MSKSTSERELRYLRMDFAGITMLVQWRANVKRMRLGQNAVEIGTGRAVIGCLTSLLKRRKSKMSLS